MKLQVTLDTIQPIARECGFEISAVAPADPPEAFALYESWIAEGHAAVMRYLADRRTAAARARDALMLVRRTHSCLRIKAPGPSTPAAASPISPSSCAARSLKNFVSPWVRTYSDATSAKMSAPGIRARRFRMRLNPI